MNQNPAATDLRYPIGQFKPVDDPLAAQVSQWLDRIEVLPRELRSVVATLSEEQLDTRYRPEGWTLRQVVHHLVDSHLNAYVRCKWALTEDSPEIKTYQEALWAELVDYRDTPIEASLQFLQALHARWIILLRGLSEDQLRRKFQHPEWGAVDIRTTCGIYAWHGRHHLAHITQTIERQGWI